MRCDEGGMMAANQNLIPCPWLELNLEATYLYKHLPNEIATRSQRVCYNNRYIFDFQ